jgi:hypothetical protein
MAKLAIGIQLLILIRLPAEVFRLKSIHGNALTLTAVDPFIRGDLITAICTAAVRLLLFLEEASGSDLDRGSQCVDADGLQAVLHVKTLAMRTMGRVRPSARGTSSVSSGS